jgi:hypothetical protein
VVCTKLTVQSDSSGTDSFVLTSCNVTDTGLGLTVSITLSDADANAIKATNTALQSLSTSFVSVDNGFVADASDNTNTASVSAVPAHSFVADSVSPFLIWFDLDVNGTRPYLHFKMSEAIDKTAINPTFIRLQATRTVSAISETVFESNVSKTDVIDLSPFDEFAVLLSENALDSLKLRGIALRANSTWLSLSPGFAQDIAGNAVEEVPFSQARPAREHVKDDTAPDVLAFSLDMSARTLSLTFDEPVDASTLRADFVRIQNEVSGPPLSIP